MEMELLLLALVPCVLAAPPSSTKDVSEQFRRSLARMLESMVGQDTVPVGSFSAGEYSVSGILMGNISTLTAASGAWRVDLGEQSAVQGSVTIANMALQGEQAVAKGGQVVHRPRLIIRDNDWTYNFWISRGLKSCQSGVSLTAFNIGGLILTSEDRTHADGEDITVWFKHHITDIGRRHISAAIERIFKNNFDFCAFLDDQHDSSISPVNRLSGSEKN